MKLKFLSAKNNEILADPFISNNPIATQVLGVCSALAVTVQIKTALVMSIALTTVLTLSNLIISILRNYIPNRIRIIVELVVIATLVIGTDQILKAFSYQLSKQLSVFVGLIITNCIVMGRAEAFALGNPPFESILDGLGNGAGYSIILIAVATVREILGSGKFLGYAIVPQKLYESGYTDMGIMVLAPSAFLILGLICWLQQEIILYRERK
ncbi:NADH:ubiquinone reductase (Na(+)-transporting) subunit D [Candidatus Riflebacteria bacterium]